MSQRVYSLAKPSPIMGRILGLMKPIAPDLRWPWRAARLARMAGVGAFAEATVGPCRLVLDTRDMLQFEMLHDAYEPKLAALIRAALRPGDTYLDVGAQLGYTAAIAAGCVGPKGHIILFEPDPRILPRLRAHMASMPRECAPRVSLIEKGASDRPGRFTFQLGGILEGV